MDRAAIARVFRLAEARFGRLGVVVTNAGYAVEGGVEGVEEEVERAQMEVCFWGPVYVMKEARRVPLVSGVSHGLSVVHAIRLFRDVNPPGRGGRVLNISSACGYSGNPTLSYHCSAKFGESMYAICCPLLTLQELSRLTESFVKEMPPEWNITGVIVEPGGFRTDWAGGSLVRFPPPPQYESESSPSVLFRKQVTSQTFIGDPVRAAKALVQIADMDKPPLRIQLGSECLFIVRHKAMNTIADGEK